MVTQREAGSAQVYSQLERAGSRIATLRPRLPAPSPVPLGQACPLGRLAASAAIIPASAAMDAEKGQPPFQRKRLIQEKKRWQTWVEE